MSRFCSKRSTMDPTLFHIRHLVGTRRGLFSVSHVFPIHSPAFFIAAASVAHLDTAGSFLLLYGRSPTEGSSTSHGLRHLASRRSRPGRSGDGVPSRLYRRPTGAGRWGAADQRAAARERFEAEIKGKAYEVIPDSKHWRERARELEGDVVFGTLPQGLQPLAPGTPSHRHP